MIDTLRRATNPSLEGRACLAEVMASPHQSGQASQAELGRQFYGQGFHGVEMLDKQVTACFNLVRSTMCQKWCFQIDTPQTRLDTEATFYFRIGE